MAKYNYMKEQLSVILPEDATKRAGVKVKFNSADGVTNWLSIKEETFKKLQAILEKEDV